QRTGCPAVQPLGNSRLQRLRVAHPFLIAADQVTDVLAVVRESTLSNAGFNPLTLLDCQGNGFPDGAHTSPPASGSILLVQDGIRFVWPGSRAIQSRQLGGLGFAV